MALPKRRTGYVTPKKSLGQHFLKDDSIAQRIAQTVSDGPANVLEVGPGMGVLTRHLIEMKDKNLRAVELDRESVDYLLSTYTELNGKIISADFLKLDIATLFDGDFSVIGNYPYNISSQIFFKVLDNRDRIPLCTGMVQKEVAERMAAKPGSKIYGILSVLLQAYYDIDYLFTVEPGVFDPPPKVKSAVVSMKRNEVKSIGCNETLFAKVVKTTFNTRRKMLRNSLRSLVGEDCPLLETEGMERRPEQLSVKEFIDLTNTVEQYVKAEPAIN